MVTILGPLRPRRRQNLKGEIMLIWSRPSAATDPEAGTGSRAREPNWASTLGEKSSAFVSGVR